MDLFEAQHCASKRLKCSELFESLHVRFHDARRRRDANICGDLLKMRVKKLKILTNYANWRFRFARRYNSVTGAQAAGMDRVIEYSPKDIAREYRRRNRKLFRRTKGAGYWLWKPWIVVETLKHIKEDDVLVYSDAGIIFLHPIEPLVQRMEETGQDVMAFLNKDLNFCKDGFWTKRDAFLLLDCDSPEYTETAQCWAGFHLWKKTEFSMEFARQWLHYIQDERLVGDRPNQLGLPNHPGFKGHRHDQSVFSLLAKKHGLILHRCPMAGRDKKIPVVSLRTDTRK